MNNIQLTTEQKIYQWVSGNYLTKRIPTEVILSKNENAIYEYINEYVAHQYFQYKPEEIDEMI